MIELESRRLIKSQGSITEKIDTNSYPTVTIGIPVLNEEEHIERVIKKFLNSDYPNLKEVLVADGGSTDSTRKLVTNLSEEDSRVKLIDNPEQYQSFGLNRMIRAADGEIFIRADAHCDYGENYICKCVENKIDKKATNVGGAARFLATNIVQAGTATAVLSLLGNGGAKHYNPDYEGYADTVPMGCFWLSDLKKLNGFTESNHTNEDAEINYRIQKDLKGKVFISPEIRLYYYPRDSFFAMFSQYFRYGRGRYLTSTMHLGKIPLRSRAPFLFISFLIPFIIADYLFFSEGMISLYIVSSLTGMLLIESFRLAVTKRSYFKNEVWKKDGKTPGLIPHALSTFLVLILMNFGHFLGYGYQKLKMLFGKKGW